MQFWQRFRASVSHLGDTLFQPSNLRAQLIPVYRSVIGVACIAGLSNSSLLAQVCPQDAFEPNEFCAQVTTLPAGTTGGLTSGDQENDFYRLVVPAGHLVEVRMRVQNPTSSLAMFFGLLEANSETCASLGSSGAVGGGYFHPDNPDIRTGWASPPGESAEFFVSLFTFGDANGCLNYELDVSFTPSTCTPLATDGFLLNHSCETAAPVGEGIYPGLRASASENDYYMVDVPSNSIGLVEVTDIVIEGQVYIWVYESSSACTAGDHIKARLIFADAGGVYIPNSTGRSQSYVIEVEPSPEALSQEAFCLDYSLRVSSQGHPCGGFQGDLFEPNDTVASATHISQSELGLTSTAIDSDYFTIDVPPRGTLTVIRSGSLFPSHFNLYSENREFYLSGNEFIGANINDPRQRIEWTNNSFATRSTLLYVSGNRSFPTPFCGTYDLEIEITYGGIFCIPTVNSTGDSVVMKATGSIIVGQGSLYLTAGPTPPGQFGLTFFGPGLQAPTPLSGGTLCISGLLRRLPIASQVGDGLRTTIDWSNPGVASVIHSGSTWYFQTWYRENGGLSNVSEGKGITFQ